MTSLLQRMVERTRSSLPSIEPLVPSRFAPPRDLAAPSQLASVEPREDIITSEIEATRTRRRPDRVPSSAATSGTNRLEPQSQEPPSELNVAAENTHPTLRQRPSFVQPTPIEVDSLSGETPASIRDSIRRPVSSEPVEVNVEERSHSSLDLKTETVPKPVVASLITETPRYEAHKPQASDVKPGEISGKQEQQQVATAGETPRPRNIDVTVSIDHIEVRAAQASEKPRAPVFRPRISLSEFLKQSGGRA